MCVCVCGIHVCVCVRMCIHIHIYRERERESKQNKNMCQDGQEKRVGPACVGVHTLVGDVGESTAVSAIPTLTPILIPSSPGLRDIL